MKKLAALLVIALIAVFMTACTTVQAVESDSILKFCRDADPTKYIEEKTLLSDLLKEETGVQSSVKAFRLTGGSSLLHNYTCTVYFMEDGEWQYANFSAKEIFDFSKQLDSMLCEIYDG